MDLAYRIYASALAVVCILAVFQHWADFRSFWQAARALSPLRRTAAAVFINAFLNAIFVVASGIDDPWPWYIATDAVAAAIVLHQPAGKAQSVVGGLYMAQIVMHGVYGALVVSGEPISKDAYWQILIAIAFLQLLVLGGWTVGHHGRRIVRHLGRGRRSAVAESKGRKGVAG